MKESPENKSGKVIPLGQEHMGKYHERKAARLAEDMSPYSNPEKSGAENLVTPLLDKVPGILAQLDDFEFESGHVDLVHPDVDDYSSELNAGLFGDLQIEYPDIVRGSAVIFEYKQPGDNYFNHKFVYKYAETSFEIDTAFRELHAMIDAEKARRNLKK